MRRSQADPIDGILLVDKSLGMSSNGALQRARRLLGARKAGHTGTLDPLATGLLPLTFGEATKFSADLLDADKEYLADVRLGVTTTSGDAEGDVVARAPVTFSPSDLERVLAQFTGDLAQVPPMFSALKHNGRPLYELARQGIDVERTSRSIRILELECLGLEHDRLHLRVHCSKGTYIRVLAHDIGAALGCGAHLGGLRRTRVGGLSIQDAVDLASIEAEDLCGRRARLLPVDHLLRGLPKLSLSGELAARFCQGQRLIDVFDVGEGSGLRRVRVYDAKGRLLGVARADRYRVEPERLTASMAPTQAACAQE
jgi:tRNA pseudouridine55 synthase